jgi:phosphate/sulfate permease
MITTRTIVILLFIFSIVALFFAMVLSAISTANITKNPQKARDYGIYAALLQSGAIAFVLSMFIILLITRYGALEKVKNAFSALTVGKEEANPLTTTPPRSPSGERTPPMTTEFQAQRRSITPETPEQEEARLEDVLLTPMDRGILADVTMQQRLQRLRRSEGVTPASEVRFAGIPIWRGEESPTSRSARRAAPGREVRPPSRQQLRAEQRAYQELQQSINELVEGYQSD